MKKVIIDTNLEWWMQYLPSDTGLDYSINEDETINISYHNDQDLLNIGRDFGIWCVRNSVVGIAYIL